MTEVFINIFWFCAGVATGTVIMCLNVSAKEDEIMREKQYEQNSMFGSGPVVDMTEARKYYPATVSQLNYIHGLYNQRERDEVLRKYNIRTLNELSMKEASELIDEKKEK